jgi:hypothetical protein
MPEPPGREDEEYPSSFSDKPIRRRVRKRARPRYEQDDYEGQDASEEAVSTIIPYKNPKALIAYYLGIFGLIPCLGLILGPAAIVLGIMGLRYKATHPQAKGTAHAIVGIVLGSIETLANLGVILFYALLFIGSLKGQKRSPPFGEIWFMP